jgi:hypothetical protein
MGGQSFAQVAGISLLGAILVASLWQANPLIGGSLLVLIVIVMVSRIYMQQGAG